MGIGVERLLHRGVAEVLADYKRAQPGVDQVGGAGMAEPMEFDEGDPGRLDVLLHHPSDGGPAGVAAGEEDPVPGVAGEVQPVLGEGGRKIGGQGDGGVAALVLGRRQVAEVVAGLVDR